MFALPVVLAMLLAHVTAPIACTTPGKEGAFNAYLRVMSQGSNQPVTITLTPRP